MGHRKTAVLLIPLYVDRVREFVKKPTLKTWGKVSRLIKSPMTYPFRYGRSSDLPILACQLLCSGNHSCLGCPLYHNSHCLTFGMFHHNNLAGRLDNSIKFLAAVDCHSGISTLNSKPILEAQLHWEKEVDKRLSMRRARIEEDLEDGPEPILNSY